MPRKGAKCACGCGQNAGAVSQDFATEGCQRRWARQQVGLPAGEGSALFAAALAASTATTEAVWQGTYTEHVARWWTYDRRRMLWELRESDGTNTRSLHYISEEIASQTQAAGRIEAYLRRRYGGHIPPIPTRYLP